MVATHEDQHEAIDATLADHDSQLGLLRRNLDRQFQEIMKISLIIGAHTNTLDGHSKILTEHTSTLAEHSAILAEHSAILAEHSAILDRAAILSRALHHPRRAHPRRPHRASSNC